jgi:hypothetical protein
MIPLLQPAQTVLEFDPPEVRKKFFTEPLFVFTLIFILIIFLSSMIKKSRFLNIVDIIIFAFYALLAALMIFFNFFTDHQQMKWNLNIIWLNPFIIICFISILLKKNWPIWFKLVFYLCTLFLPFAIFFPGLINNAFVPLVLILGLRCSARGAFNWNPLSASIEKAK